MALAPRPFRPRLLLALITVVAALVRFGGLTAQSFWLDEYLWTQNSAGSVGEILRLDDGYPPLFGLIVRGLLAVGLTSDWWLRVPSAVAGTLAVPLTYAVGRRVAGRTPALVAAGLLALNPLAIWYSQECGAYSLLLLCALVSTLCFVHLLAGAGARAATAYWLAICLGFGLHYYFAFVVASHAAIASWDFLRHRERRRMWLGLGVATVGAFGVWGQAFVYDVAAQSAEDTTQPRSLLALPYTMLTFVGGFSLGAPLRGLHEALHGAGPVWAVVAPHTAVTVVAIGVSGMLAVLALARGWTTSRALAAVLIALPVLGAWLASVGLVGYRPRYAFAALPFALIWCASALRTRFRRPAAILLVVLACLELGAVRGIDALPYAREDTRGAAAYVRPDRGAVVVLVGDAAETFDRYGGSAARQLLIADRDVATEPALHARLGPLLAGREEIWLLSSRPWTVDAGERVRALLDARLAVREEAHFAGVELRRYANAPARTASPY